MRFAACFAPQLNSEVQVVFNNILILRVYIQRQESCIQDANHLTTEVKVPGRCGVKLQFPESLPLVHFHINGCLCLQPLGGRLFSPPLSVGVARSAAGCPPAELLQKGRVGRQAGFWAERRGVRAAARGGERSQASCEQ